VKFNLYEIPRSVIKDDKIHINKGSFIGRFWHSLFVIYPIDIRYIRAKIATKITVFLMILFMIMIITFCVIRMVG